MPVACDLDGAARTRGVQLSRGAAVEEHRVAAAEAAGLLRARGELDHLRQIEEGRGSRGEQDGPPRAVDADTGPRVGRGLRHTVLLPGDHDAGPYLHGSARAGPEVAPAQDRRDARAAVARDVEDGLPA